jgi:putative transposase
MDGPHRAALLHRHALEADIFPGAVKGRVSLLDILYQGSALGLGFSGAAESAEGTGLYGIFGDGVVHAMFLQGRRFLGSRRLECVLSVYGISENALAPFMARPARNARADEVLSSARCFFVTTGTADRRRLLQSERNASLLIDVLRSYVADRKFRLHDFVVMPDHVHLLMTVDGETTIEKAMQLIKGRFSFRLKKEFGYCGEVWQHGFSEVRADDKQKFVQFRNYIAENPLRAGLVAFSEQYPYCFAALARKKQQGLKPAPNSGMLRGTAKAEPLYNASD